jgi:hypothetical protein
MLTATWTASLLVVFVLVGSVDSRAEPAPSVTARVSDGNVYVEFVGASEPIDIVNDRLSQAEGVSLAWIVELRRITRNWRDRTVMKATVQTFVDPAPTRGLFVVRRRFNGQTLDQSEPVERDIAQRLAFSFRLPLFRTSDVEPGAYEVTVRAAVFGDAEAVASGIIARADVIP